MSDNTNDQVETPQGDDQATTPDEGKAFTRVSAATVVEDAYKAVKAAGKDGITLKDLAKALVEAGHYDGIPQEQVSRKVHNVRWHLLGCPDTGSKVFKHKDAVCGLRGNKAVALPKPKPAAQVTDMNGAQV